ncbi:hypothetical protein HPB49_023410 [Dermacentor silvarum]|uniref:Uncharacterized protein n=1 Tax=Dermacentor silvarum TaxID=543639 RepID=A0ACB8CNC6_DERSI|nr:hypothetical protein HPB49_023410 [Dermacentor silvarum]
MRSAAWPLVFLALSGVSCQGDSDLTVSTSTGRLRGVLVPTTAGPVRAFLGVPFAEPPIGSARFKKPQQKKPWNGVFDATAFPPMCPQLPIRFNNYYLVKNSDRISEDCLFINVFAPINRERSLKPVVVYIHGGFFSYGGISMKLHDASELSAREELVVVTIAYRLGAFGFLSVGTEDAPGNMGLHDQILALRWIKSNANAFGGDPDRVTIVGQSAGAFSVGIHLISPKSKGLFRRAIMQSGSPFTSTLPTGAGELARVLNCPPPMMMMQGGGADAMLKCLRSKDVASILNATASFTIEGLDGFFPVIGDDVIPVKPGVALRSGNLNARELLAGISEAEGDGLIHFMAKKFYNTNDADEVRKDSMIFVARGTMITLLGFDSKRAIDRYFSDSQVQGGTNALHAAADLIGDSQLGCPTVGFAKRFVNPDTRVFMYKFSQQPSRVNWPKWVRPTHTDEIAFALGSIFKLDPEISLDDVRAAENFMHIVSTFSRTGVILRTGEMHEYTASHSCCENLSNLEKNEVHGVVMHPVHVSGAK